MWLRKEEISEETFWAWFKEHSEQLRPRGKLPTRRFLQLVGMLRRVHPRLEFELGADELVLSAGGNKEVATVVRKLVAAAPQLPNWKITAFRQANTETKVIKIRGVTMNLDTCRFRFRLDGNMFDLLLLIPTYKESKKKNFWAAAVILLDHLLGEELAMNSIRTLRLDSLRPEDSDAPLLRDLPGVVSERH